VDANVEFVASWGAWLKAAGLTEDTPRRSSRTLRPSDRFFLGILIGG
jgi:hypothetical protein